MVRLRINDKPITVEEGTTLLQAAHEAGFEIPTMCHLEKVSIHPSCMVCVVGDLDHGKMYPSCAMPVAEGMNIITESPEIHEFRKNALELLLSEHIGDCEAPCRLSCPAFMDIPLMNRLIAEGRFEEALMVVRQEIALPFILGYICPAPCEKACKRKPIDGAVSICLLKRFTATDPQSRFSGILPSSEKSGKRVAILGTGPAGLSAAFYLLKLGHDCILFDKQELAGGALRYNISDAELPREVLDAELDVLRQMGAIFILNNTQSFTKLKENGFGNFDAFILATGSQELHPVDEAISPETFHHHFINKETFETSIPGVFACGNILREQKMAVRAGAQGKAAAINVDRYLNGLSAFTENSTFNSSFGILKQEEYPEYMKESSNPGKRLSEGSDSLGYTAIEAMQEAKRCMHCDCRKPESCLLRAHATQYGADKKHYSSGERECLTKSIQNEWIVFEPGKCIKCGLCIEITAREAEPLGLTFIGRGFDVKVKAPFNKDTGELMRRTALACAKACPTAAISEKLIEERHSQTEKPSNE